MLAQAVVALCRVMVAFCLVTVLFEPGSVGADEWPFVDVAPGQLTSLREVGTDKPFGAVGVNYFGPHTGWAPKIWQRFDLKDNSRHVDFTTIHFYPIAPPKPCDAPSGIDHNGVYLETLLSECSVGKPVMIGEFAWYGGGDIRAGDRVIMPTQSLEDQVAWNQRLLDVSRGRVCGWLHWAFADTPTSQDLTRRSGLWTEDLQLKPWGRVFGAFASEATRLPVVERPFDQPWGDRQIDRRQVLTAPKSGGEF